jgi:two-component system, cell cycle sensor histidine kinase and response regulator CckA
MGTRPTNRSETPAASAGACQRGRQKTRRSRLHSSILRFSADFSTFYEVSSSAELNTGAAMPDLQGAEEQLSLEKAELRAGVGSLEDDLRVQTSLDAVRREREAQCWSSLQELRIGIVVRAPDKTILFCNPEALRFLGPSAALATGKTDFDSTWRLIQEDGSVIPPEQYPFNQVLATLRPFRDRVVGVDRPDTGGRVWSLVNAYPEFGPKRELLRIVITFVDITERKRAEEALAQSEARFRQMADSIEDVLYSVDGRSGEFQYVSPAFERMLGYALEDVARMGGREDFLTGVIQGAQFGEQNRVFQEMQRGSRGAPVQWQTWWRCKDGTLKFIEDRWIPSYAGEALQSTIGVLRDITGRKKAEEALRQSEERYRRLFSEMTIGCSLQELITDETGKPVDYITLDVNEAFERLLGAKRADVVGRRASEILPPDELASWLGTFGPVVLTGNSTHWVKYSSLNQKYFEGNAYSSGPRRFASTFMDITDRKRAEQALIESETMLNETGRMAKVGGWAIDLERGSLKWTRQVYSIHEVAEDFQPTVESAIGFYAPESRPVIGEAVEKAIRLGESFDVMLELITATGRHIWVNAMGHAVVEHGKARAVVGTFQDVTVRKHADEEKAKLHAQLMHAQRMESVGRLAGGVAHDFNNLLMGIMGYADLSRGKLPPGHPIGHYLDEITDIAKRSAQLTRQLLAFARKQTIMPVVLDLNDTVASMLKLLRRLIGEDIELTWIPGPHLWPVKLDPSQIDQLLANLCINSRDAISGPGKVTVESSNVVLDKAYCADHNGAVPGDYVMLAVSDNGCGMTQETLERIFEPFFTTKGVGKGTGLGLAMVYGIVKQNNGYINVQSEPDKGTTFRLHFPRHVDDAPRVPQAGAAEAPRGSGEVILLVEDEKSLRTTCSHFLRALGYAVLAAETPAAAVEQAAGFPGDIHLLLTDVIMPGMNGQQLAHALASIKPDMKLLFMSGYTADVIANQGIIEDGISFISKPFSRDDLARKVREVLAAAKGRPG